MKLFWVTYFTIAAEQGIWRPRSCYVTRKILPTLKWGKQVNKWTLIHSHNHKDAGMATVIVGERLHRENKGETHTRPSFPAPQEAPRLFKRISSPTFNLHVAKKL